MTNSAVGHDESARRASAGENGHRSNTFIPPCCTQDMQNLQSRLSFSVFG